MRGGGIHGAMKHRLVEGSMREARLDVRVDTGAPFQLQAAKCLLGDGE